MNKNQRLVLLLLNQLKLEDGQAQTNFGGEYPSHTATFVLPYRINDGAGVTINASVELRLGSEVNTVQHHYLRPSCRGKWSTRIGN